MNIISFSYAFFHTAVIFKQTHTFTARSSNDKIGKE